MSNWKKFLELKNSEVSIDDQEALRIIYACLEDGELAPGNVSLITEWLLNNTPLEAEVLLRKLISEDEGMAQLSLGYFIKRRGAESLRLITLALESEDHYLWYEALKEGVSLKLESKEFNDLLINCAKQLIDSDSTYKADALLLSEGIKGITHSVFWKTIDAQEESILRFIKQEIEERLNSPGNEKVSLFQSFQQGFPLPLFKRYLQYINKQAFEPRYYLGLVKDPAGTSCLGGEPVLPSDFVVPKTEDGSEYHFFAYIKFSENECLAFYISPDDDNGYYYKVSDVKVFLIKGLKVNESDGKPFYKVPVVPTEFVCPTASRELSTSPSLIKLLKGLNSDYRHIANYPSLGDHPRILLHVVNDRDLNFGSPDSGSVTVTIPAGAYNAKRFEEVEITSEYS